jgi:hypothetical protein
MLFCVFRCQAMKKALSLILSFIYIVSASGLTVHEHYCMGEKAGTSIFGQLTDRCSVCGMERGKENKECCKDVKHFVKGNAPHQSSSIAPNCPANQETTLPIPYIVLSDHLALASPLLHSDEQHAPPPGISQPIYIEVGNMRI